MAARLNRDWQASPARAHAIEEYYRAATAEFRELLRARGYRPEELGEHAALPDTALALAVDPSLVRAEPPADARMPGAGSGADGDPRRASADSAGSASTSSSSARSQRSDNRPSDVRSESMPSMIRARCVTAGLLLGAAVGLAATAGGHGRRDGARMPPVVDPTNLYSETTRDSERVARQRPCPRLRAPP